MRGSNPNGNSDINASLQSEIESLLLQQQRNRSLILERERDLDINRSGSAPPTVEGAAGSLFSIPNSTKIYDNINHNNNDNIGVLTEEEIRSHPAYLEYYYSHENLNPRLPPPTLSREDWKVAQRIRAAGFSLGLNLNNDNGGSSSSSLFSMQPGASVKKGEDEMIELRKAALRNLSRKNSVESLEKSMIGASSSGMGARRKSFEGRGQPVKSNLSRTASQNSVAEVLDSMGISNSDALQLLNKPESIEAQNSGSANPSSFSSSSLASTRAEMLLADNLNSAAVMSRGQLHAENISKMGIPTGHKQNEQQYYGDNDINYVNLTRTSGYPRRSYSTTNLQSQVHNPDFPKNDTGSPSTGANGDGQRSRTIAPPPGFHFPVMDPNRIQYMQRTPNHGMNSARISGSFPHSHDDLLALEKAYLELLILQQRQQYLLQRQQYESLLLQKHDAINHQYNVNPAFAASYQESPVLNSQNPRVGSRSPVLQKEKSAQSPSALRSLKSESTGSLHSQSSGTSTKGRFESLLEVLKNNKTKSLELSDIVGHVVEFSTDQFGSRFIQQKLESATVEEKTKILVEIIPNARSLMIDVFGNYVIQKFFEHGTESQRKELAGHLIGHVLPLTLQMYGCRVIQKALEVVDTELQTQMVAELDGSVMKCVHDQNGNHVIQKCIECVPQDRIQFIITPFLGQVVTLSTHPYGCRVIQRVLEHCADPKTLEIIMDEIMGSVCKLAQDQYGNYVIQHVVQHGKPHERSAIITKLAGQIVKMSQQKFASNVIEKCLTFGGPDERKLLVNEMLGSTDENEPLQAMMKDPFGNYVVQKVLETCDDKSRELIISRIKVHLNALKRYTYGKHIVSRVEKLVTTGDEYIALQHLTLQDDQLVDSPLCEYGNRIVRFNKKVPIC
ncbi:hypothetical protein DH2020_028336 [Rehmannia glutinosa]|uniref:PUM-HD domain-containing protein n=1 Tax=Rehmannia glutinosa TaxID=99300 RepID=A0ABR0VRN9_REHGL